MLLYREKTSAKQKEHTYRPPDTITYDCNIADKV